MDDTLWFSVGLEDDIIHREYGSKTCPANCGNMFSSSNKIRVLCFSSHLPGLFHDLLKISTIRLNNDENSLYNIVVGNI